MVETLQFTRVVSLSLHVTTVAHLLALFVRQLAVSATRVSNSIWPPRSLCLVMLTTKCMVRVEIESKRAQTLLLWAKVCTPPFALLITF